MDNFLIPGRMALVIDGQFGSTGKGLVAGWLARRERPDIAVTNAAPNAGHTFIDINGDKYVTRHLPISALLDEETHIYLCAGSIIDPTVLREEMSKYMRSAKRLHIHPHAAVITERDIEDEYRSKTSKGISSTQKGVGQALSKKVRRAGRVAKDHPWLSQFVDGFDLESHLADGAKVLMEVPQGFGLSLNSGFYPYCTSREVSVAQSLSDAGLHPRYLGNIMVTLRTFPIRVGNLMDEDGEEIGYSGPFYPDSEEVSWTDLGVDPETTTVTGRIRRVATFSWLQYAEIVRKLRPTHMFINFLNYMDAPTTDQFLEELVLSNELTSPWNYVGGFGPSIQDLEILFTNAAGNRIVDQWKEFGYGEIPF